MKIAEALKKLALGAAAAKGIREVVSTAGGKNHHESARLDWRKPIKRVVVKGRTYLVRDILEVTDERIRVVDLDGIVREIPIEREENEEEGEEHAEL